MPQRLTPLEVSLLALDTPHTPAHVGTVDVFSSDEHGLEYEHIVGLIRERLAYVPRYRQRIVGVPARLAGPVWVDDENFDLTFHVRRSALPRPGTDKQLMEFVGRVLGRRLDRSRPMWEMYLVEGLAGDRFALLSKTHLCLVDGVDTVDLGQVLLDADPGDLGTIGPETWRPAREPSPIDLIVGAIVEGARDPAQALVNFRGAVTGALGVAVAVGEAVGGVGAAFGELAAGALQAPRAPSGSPFGGPVSEQRRVATLQLHLPSLKAIRAEHNHTINDVILAAITGGLRGWLLTRGESLNPGSVATALVPMSVTEEEGVPSSLGSVVAPHLQTLPIGEPNALMRLHQVAYGTQEHKDSGRAVGARSLADLAGFAPTTLHALGVRVSMELVRKSYDLLITNVPGPQVPLYMAGSQLVASYPVQPLSVGHQLTIGITSYDGEVFLGFNADRDAMSDLDVLVQCIEDAMEELSDTIDHAAERRQPTRKASPAAKRAAAKKAAVRKESERVTGQRRAAVRKLASQAGALGAATLRPPAAKRTTAARAASAKRTTAAKAATPKVTTPEPTTPEAATPKATAPKATAPPKATASRTRPSGPAAEPADAGPDPTTAE